MIRVNLKTRTKAYYIRWYHDGWHSHFFAGADESLNTSGEIFKTNVDYEISLGDEDLTKSELYAISGLLHAKYIQMLTSDGWKACTIGSDTFNFGQANRIGASVAFRLKVWAKVGIYTPIVLPVIIPPATPEITITESLTSFSAVVGTPSATQSYLVEGTNLQANIRIYAPTEFEISVNESTWASTLSLTQVRGAVSQTIYIRLNPTIAGSGNKTISHESTNATTKNITLAYESTAVTVVKYGYLYPWSVTQGSGTSSIIPADMAALGWVVPTDTQFSALITYLGGYTVAGGKLRETGTAYWDDSTGASNSAAFNARGGGGLTGATYYAITVVAYWWTATAKDASNAWTESANAYNAETFRYYYLKTNSNSIRLVNPSTSLTNGQTGTYTGNDGRVYRTICINDQEWLADNLAETMLRDLSSVTRYAYNNDESNVLI